MSIRLTFKIFMYIKERKKRVSDQKVSNQVKSWMNPLFYTKYRPIMSQQIYLAKAKSTPRDTDNS
jgi:hypothetical protein